MRIEIDDLTGAEIAALLREHLDFVVLHSPPESCHAFDLDALRIPEITFWTAWEDDRSVLLGCGALHELDPIHGEVKSMRTADAHRRRGVGARILARIIETAIERGYRRLSLETGSADAYLPARTLYARHGFVECPPFGSYVEDPYSVFMTREFGGTTAP